VHPDLQVRHLRVRPDDGRRHAAKAGQATGAAGSAAEEGAED